MAGISFGGINTGLPPNLVDQLVEAERIPIKKMEHRKQKSETRLGLVNSLEEKLNALQGSIGTLASTKGFNDLKLQTGDPNIVQGVVDPEFGATGSWNIEVVELAQKASAVTNGFPDKDQTEIGVGYFRFETADGPKEVYINGDNNTLQGAAAAINAANLGLKASVINDRRNPDAPFRMIIAGESVGGDSKVEYPTLYFLDGDQDLYFDEERPAKNGIIKVDGFEFEVGSTTVEDVIPGVTLDLKQASPGRQVNISVKEDKEVVSGKIKEFVDGLNGVLQFIQSQNRIDANTDTTQTLGGDTLIRSVETRMRRLIQGMQMGTGSSIVRLNQLGIVYNRNGTVDFDEEKFNSVLAKQPAEVQKFLAGDGFNVGFVPTLKRELSTLMNSAFGPVAIRKRALRDKIDRIDQNIERKEKQVAKKEDMLKRRFARLEETMSRLKSQGGALSGMASGGIPGLNLSGGAQ